MASRFISFEGVDGAGKSTQLASVAKALQQRGIEPLCTREPGGTPLGESLRALMLQHPMTPLTETLLMFAARAEHVRLVIAPALAAGRWVLCDRFIDASYAYQGAARGVATARLDALARWVSEPLAQGAADATAPAAAPRGPDLTVWVDVDPAQAQQRRSDARNPDRFEREAGDFFETVRRGYRERAAGEPGRFLRVDGSLPVTAGTTCIMERLAPWLP
jgi:dTMP kinase